MDLLIIILFLFVLGTLAMYVLQVAKNVAYVFFVLLLGWGVWQFIGPGVLPEGTNLVDGLKSFNAQYNEEVRQNLEEALSEPDYDLGGRMKDKLMNLSFPAEQEEDPGNQEEEEDARNIEAAEEAVHESAQKQDLVDRIIDKLVAEMKGMIRDLVSE